MADDKKNQQVNPWRALAVVGVIGIDITILLLAGIWVGKQIDTYFQTSPMFLIIGMLIGFILGILSTIKLIKPFLGD